MLRPDLFSGLTHGSVAHNPADLSANKKSPRQTLAWGSHRNKLLLQIVR
jgi:hypothetical protein